MKIGDQGTIINFKRKQETSSTNHTISAHFYMYRQFKMKTSVSFPYFIQLEGYKVKKFINAHATTFTIFICTTIERS